MPKIIIDNRHIQVPAGTKIIEAAEQLGIMIPRFCYHPALGSVGACRVCAVAFVEGPLQGVQMSCMVNAQDGMVVSTTDAEAVDFRRHVIEWLMLNHPHDCPVCDEGGHCLLQDLTVSGGHGIRRYKGRKRTHIDQPLGPFIQHEMNRCIQCYRCARYYQEFAGSRDLGVMGIGSRVYFGRSRPGTLESHFSGNLIDICPTGVYTDKPSRFLGRRWDFQRAPALCLHCALGCNLVASSRYRQVVRHEAAPNSQVNGHFICDRGRYGYDYANIDSRPRRALVNGREHGIEDALNVARQALHGGNTPQGSGAVAVIGSVRSNLETLAVVHHLCTEHQWAGPTFEWEARKAGNLANAARCLESELAVSLAAVSVADTVLVIGADPLNEAPMLSLSLRQAWRQGGYVVVIDPRPVDLPFEFEHLAAVPGDLAPWLDRLIGHCAADSKVSTQSETGASQSEGPGDIDSRLRSLAKKMCQSRRVVVVCGTDITTGVEIVKSAELVKDLRRTDIEAKLFYPMSGPNALAAGLLMEHTAGVEDVLHRIEKDTVKTLIVVENDLWRGFPDRDRMNAALDRLDYLIVLDHLASPLCERASVFIPTQTMYESGGHWINQEGRLQAAQPVMTAGEPIEITGAREHPPRVFEDRVPGGAPLPAWQVLLKLVDPDQPSQPVNLAERLEQVMQTIRPNLGLADGIKVGQRLALAGAKAAAPLTVDSDPQQGVMLLLVDRTFGTEILSSCSSAVMARSGQPQAVVHPGQAAALALRAGDHIRIDGKNASLTLPVAIDARMANGVIVIPRHTALAWQVMGATRMTLSDDRIRVIENPDQSGGDA